MLLLQDSLLVNPDLLPQGLSLNQSFVAFQGENHAWLFFLFVLQLGIFGWLRLYFPNRFQLLINAFVSNRFVSQLTREERSSSTLYNFVIELQYFLSLSIFIYLVNVHHSIFQFSAQGFLLLVFVFFALVLLSLVKSLFINLMIWLFNMESAAADILFYRFLSHTIIGLGLLVLCVLWAYSNFPTGIFFYGGLTFFAISFFYRVVRSGLRFWNINVYALKYIILYICALEILPVCVAIKFIFNSL